MSIILSLSAGLFASTLYEVNKSSKIDAESLKKYAKAYERQSAASELVAKKQQETDDTLIKVANRKRAILSTSVNSFLELYKRIISIHFTEGDGISELNTTFLEPENIKQLQHMAVTAVAPLSEKEMVTTFLLNCGNFGAVAVKDSKRNLAMASSQLNISRTVYSQAETVAMALDAIIIRGEKIAAILSKLNILFVHSIKTSSELIELRGTNKHNYSTDDRRVLMVCIDLADAIKKILDTPLLDSEGELTQASLTAIETGTNYLQKINEI